MRFTMKDLEEAIGFYSSKASDYCHQLAIAGIVIVWAIYSQFEKFNQCHLKILLIAALLLFLISIFISLVHYLHLAAISDKYYHKKESEFEKKGITDIVTLRKELVEEPPRLESNSWFYFRLKSAMLFAGYLAIILFVLINWVLL